MQNEMKSADLQSAEADFRLAKAETKSEGGKNKNKIKKFLLLLITITFLLPQFALARLDEARQAGLKQEELVNLINQERLKNNLSPLKIDYRLQQAALEKGLDMFYGGYFDHTSPSGKTPWDFIKEGSYNYQYAGENLAVDFLTEDKLVQRWMESGTHGANILNSNFEDLGISVISGKFQDEQTQLVVAFFGKESRAENFDFYKIIAKFSLTFLSSVGELVGTFKF